MAREGAAGVPEDTCPGKEQRGSGATGPLLLSPGRAGLMKPDLFLPPRCRVTARPDFAFICLKFFFFLAVREEGRFWQGVCSLLVSPGILDLVHLHPAVTVKDYFQSSCFVRLGLTLPGP